MYAFLFFFPPILFVAGVDKIVFNILYSKVYRYFLGQES